jgi:Ni,Fe-hydrogenase III large subunit
MLAENQTARERFERVGVISPSLAKEFGLVGVAARGSGISYDCRRHFPHGLYPEKAPPTAVQNAGDILARTRIRIAEIESSLAVIESVLANLPAGNYKVDLPEKLPPNETGLAIVEAFRGELVHMIFTDEVGAIKRYAIKDPSFNNWTAVSIAIRNNLIADFPLCNKSLALSYSGNDL